MGNIDLLGIGNGDTPKEYADKWDVKLVSTDVSEKGVSLRNLRMMKRFITYFFKASFMARKSQTYGVVAIIQLLTCQRLDGLSWLMTMEYTKTGKSKSKSKTIK